MVNNYKLSLPGFTILEKLNANHIGGRSSYLAEDIATQQMVVVKQFEFAKEGSDWSGYKQLKREIDYLQTVDHPYICKYVDTVETKAGLCLITEYIEGTPLNQLSVTPPKTINIALNILDVIIYLQNLNPPLIHRDIKPANIIIDRQGQAHLIDFGLASIINSQDISVSATFGGTLGFIPWEQLIQRKVNFTTDVYSLCAVLFVLLYPNPVSITDLIDSRNTIPVELLASKNIVERGVIDWLKKGLNPEVEKRFSNASQARLELLKAIQKEKQLGLAKELQNKPLDEEPKQIGYKNPELLNVSTKPVGEIGVRYQPPSELKQYRSSTTKALTVNAWPIILLVGTSIFGTRLLTDAIDVIAKQIVIDFSLETHSQSVMRVSNAISTIIILTVISFSTSGVVKIINNYKAGYGNAIETIKIPLTYNIFLIILNLIIKIIFA